MNINLGPLTIFFKNLRDLFKYNFRNIARRTDGKELNQMLDNLLYEMAFRLKDLKIPKLRNPIETVNDLINKKASLCRFGDGELLIMSMGTISFQEYNPKLAERLYEVLSSNDDNIFIGIPYGFYSSEGIKSGVKNANRTWAANNMDIVIKSQLEDKQYYATESTYFSRIYENYDFQSYFNNIKKIWLGRDITIICGKTVFDKIEVNIYDCAKSVEYLYAPSINAFDKYDEILAEAKKIDKNRLVIIILGPTATVLAYDLAKEGYQALDLGHLAKDYDVFVRKLPESHPFVRNFFNPD